MAMTELQERLKGGASAPRDASAPVGLIVRPLQADEVTPLTQSNAPAHTITRISTALRKNFLAILCIALPMLISSVYYLGLLSDQYVSETRFVIRSMSSSGMKGLAFVTQSQGMARTEDDTHLVNEFLRSRDAIRLLAEKDKLLPALAHPDSDIFYGFPTLLSGSTREDLYEHYATFIDVSYTSTTGITTLKVRAFTPEDAKRLATALLDHAEDVVNQLNKRARNDTVRFSEAVVAAEERRVLDAQRKIADFQNREKIFDPAKQSAATLLLVNKLAAEKSTYEARLDETRAATPDSPLIPALQNKLDAINREISALRSSLAGSSGSMAAKMPEYERLFLKRELAAKSLTAALSSLENARQEAARQQLYLERVVQPNLADKSQYPKRLLSLAAILAVCMALYLVARLLAEVVLEHDA